MESDIRKSVFAKLYLGTPPRCGCRTAALLATAQVQAAIKLPGQKQGELFSQPERNTSLARLCACEEMVTSRNLFLSNHACPCVLMFERLDPQQHGSSSYFPTPSCSQKVAGRNLPNDSTLVSREETAVNATGMSSAPN